MYTREDIDNMTFLEIMERLNAPKEDHSEELKKVKHMNEQLLKRNRELYDFISSTRAEFNDKMGVVENLFRQFVEESNKMLESSEQEEGEDDGRTHERFGH